MYKSVKDKDYLEWEVVDLDTGQKIRGVQYANDETGEVERLVFKNEEKDELLIIDNKVCPVKEKRNIKLVKK